MVVATALAALPGGAVRPLAARADDPPPPEPVVQTQQGATTPDIPRPASMLPIERGHMQDGYLDQAGLVPPLPDASLLSALRPGVLPDPLSAVRQLKVGQLVDGVTALLPQVDTTGVTDDVDALLAKLTGKVNDLATSLTGTAGALATAAAQAPRNQTATSATQSAVTFQLTTTANGLTQTFGIPLCTPTPIDVAATNTLTPTTIVSLCPVPLGVTTSPVVPPTGQPAQLYLSINRMPGTAAIPATFLAGYTVADPTGGTPFTVRFGLVSTAQAYPESSIVGAATDDVPVPLPSAAPKQPVVHLTTSWSVSSPVDAVTVEAVGTGRVAVNALPQDNGSFAIAVDNDKTTFHLLSMSPFPAGANTSITVSRPLAATAGSTSSAALTWSKLPQEFVFNLHTTQVNGQPAGIAYDGSQNMQPNTAFSIRLDYLTNGRLAGRVTQSGLGAQLSTSMTLSLDEDSNVTGVDVQSAPGATSTAALSAYSGGALTDVVELGGMPATASEVSVQLHGTVQDANEGVTVSETNAPAYVGVATYQTGTGVSTVPQGTMVFTRGATPAGLPFAIGDGAKLTLRALDMATTFKLNIQATGATGEVTGVDVSGSTPVDSRTARQIMLRAASDTDHTAVLLMNELTDEWDFKMTLHGPPSAPSGLSVSDVNTTENFDEYKELVVYTGSVVTDAFVVQREYSDRTGAITPAGVVATVSDPPASFDLSIDYTAPNVAGVHCSQALQLHGSDPSAVAGGAVDLRGGSMTIHVANVFVLGDWSVGVSATGAATNCTPDTIEFDLHQGIGANPDAVLIANAAGAGQIVLRSFSTSEKVTVRLLPDSNGGIGGVRVDGTNSEANPGMEVHLNQLNGATVQSALNIWAGGTGTLTQGAVTAILTYTPQNFGIAIQKTTDPTTGAQTAEIDSYNENPAPAETLTITTAAGSALPGGKLQLIIRSLDVATVLRLTVWPPAAGSMHARLQSQNANPNLTEVVSAALLDAASVPNYNVLFYRPNANLSGVPTGATKGVATWERMPQSFDLDVNLASDGADRTFSMDIKNAQDDPGGTLRLLQPQQNLGILFGGTGAAQSFNLTYTGTAQPSVHVSGNVPAAMGYVQAYHIVGNWQDALVTVYGTGVPAQGGTQRGTEIYVSPARGAKTYDFQAGASGKSVTLSGGGDVAGNHMTIGQFYQSDNHGPCIWSGLAYPCTDIDLYRMPVHAQLTMGLGDSLHPAPSLDYSASDSGLDLTVNALVPGIGGYLTFNGLPMSGVTFTSHLEDTGGLTATLASNDPSQPLQYFYVYGWNIEIPINIPYTQFTDSSSGLTASLGINVLYTADITITGDPGLTKAVLVSPPGSNGTWDGLLGFRVDGNPAARFMLGLNLAFNPGTHTVSWDWTLPEPLGLSQSDSDTFTWTNPYSTPMGGEAGISSYAWEARSGDDNRYAASGCSALTTRPPVIDPATEHDDSVAVPFAPGFVRVNNGAVVCGRHVAYYQVNVQDLLFKHNGWYGPDLGGDVWSHVHVGWPVNTSSDWILACAMKKLYDPDAGHLTDVPVNASYG